MGKFLHDRRHCKKFGRYITEISANQVPQIAGPAAGATQNTKGEEKREKLSD